MNATLNSGFERQEMFELLWAMRDDSLTAEQAQRLDALVCQNPLARNFYFDVMGLLASLRWTVPISETRDLQALFLNSEQTADASQADRKALLELIADSKVSPQLSAPPLGQPSAHSHRPAAILPRLIPVWSRFSSTSRAVAVGVTGLLVSYFVLLVLSLGWDQAHPGHRTLPILPAKDSSYVTLVGAIDCEWQGIPPAKLGARLDSSTIALIKGVVDLSFNDGAIVTIEGPAEFEVRSSAGGYLRNGKLVAVVQPEAIGFTVQTPNTTIVDLGTEFGVEVDAVGRTDIEVIHGKVDVHYDSSAKSERSRQSVRMTAGAARRFSNRVGGDGVAVTPIAPWVKKTTTGQRITRAQQELPAETKYAAAVLADRPLGYWRLADGGNNTAADASGNKLHGRYHGVVSTSNPGVFGGTSDRSVRFLGRSYDGWVEIPNVELPASYSIELWVRSATPEWNTFGWIVSCDSAAGAVIHPEQGTRDVSFYTVSDDGSMRNVVGFHPDDISDRFHHYVWSYDAQVDHVGVYFDGNLVCERSEPLKPKVRSRSEKLTLVLGRQHSFGAERCGEGWIDELAVYPHPLGVEAVRRHYQAANFVASNAEDRSGNTSK